MVISLVVFQFVRDPSPELKTPLVHTIYEDGSEGSEMSTHTIQTPGNHPK